MAHRYNAIIGIQTSLDCDDFNAVSLASLHDSAANTVKEVVQQKIELLPENVRQIAIITVVGIRYVMVKQSLFGQKWLHICINQYGSLKLL